MDNDYVSGEALRSKVIRASDNGYLDKGKDEYMLEGLSSLLSVLEGINTSLNGIDRSLAALPDIHKSMCSIEVCLIGLDASLAVIVHNLEEHELEEERWIERHSVNCFFCGRLFDERESEGTTAEGGDVCLDCIDKLDREHTGAKMCGCAMCEEYRKGQ